MATSLHVQVFMLPSSSLVLHDIWAESLFDVAAWMVGYESGLSCLWDAGTIASFNLCYLHVYPFVYLVNSCFVAMHEFCNKASAFA